jgi:hypothetical protein
MARPSTYSLFSCTHPVTRATLLHQQAEQARAHNDSQGGAGGPYRPAHLHLLHWHRIHSKGSIHIIQSICMVLVSVGNACARVIYHTHLAVSHHAVLLLCRHFHFVFFLLTGGWSMSRPPRICHLMARKEAPLSLLLAPFSCVLACYCGRMLPALFPWSESSSCKKSWCKCCRQCDWGRPHRPARGSFAQALHCAHVAHRSLIHPHTTAPLTALYQVLPARVCFGVCREL